MDVEQTLVIFRKYKKKYETPLCKIVALFPEEKFDYDGHCAAYEHIGQHGAADYGYVISITRAATPEEYNDLKEELTSIGYNLKIRKKWIRGRNK